MKGKTNIAIYMRLSQEDGDFEAESNSIVNQRNLIYSYVAKHFANYDLYEFKDDGYTGANFDRPGVTELLDKVREGKIDCIIVKDLSRFSRDYIEIGAYLEKVFPFAGVRFIAINDRYDSDCYKGDVAGLDTSFKNLLNDLYCKDISVKVKSSLRIKKEKGIYANGSCPFGYRKDPKDRHKLLIAEEEAAVIRRIFQMTLDGMSSQKIAQQFNAESVKTPIEYQMERGLASRIPKGKRFEWNGSTICQILRNATYAGDMVYDKYETLEVSGKSKLKPRSQWKTFKNHHEAIIDRDTFEYIQQNRGRRKTVKHKRHPLIGKIECGYCHRALKIERTKNPYFFCGNKYMTSYEGCVSYINVQFLEQYLLFRLQEEADRQAEIQPILIKTKNKFREDLKIAYDRNKKISEKIKNLHTVQAEIYEAYVFKKKNRNDYIKEKQDLVEQMKRCIERQKKLEKYIEVLQEKIAEAECGVYEYLKKYSFAELTQGIVDRFVKRIVIYDERIIDVEWNFSEKLPKELLQYQVAIM